MSARENRKLQRGIRREARKVAPAFVLLINRSSLLWRMRLAWRVIRADVRMADLAETADPNTPRQPLHIRPERS